jgi:hypothetical protein
VWDGKVQADLCEIAVADHCNLACRGCSHLAPALPRWFADVASVRRDLTTLAKAYHATAVALLGGEPLLHPRLLDLIAAVRAAGICEAVIVATNGVLLWRMPEAFWAAVDAVEVSAYPGAEMPPERMLHCSRMAQRHGTHLAVKYYARFREQVAPLGSEDRRLVERIYDTCEAAHVSRLHWVVDGYFYKCPQAYSLAKGLDGNGTSVVADGVPIVDSPDLARQLLTYLLSTEPLQACSRCLGTVGRRFDHAQEPRGARGVVPARITEELVDFERLERLERGERGEEAPLLRARHVADISPVVPA